ncbi:MAG: GAF domain-containing protein [Polyangiaceae bacterium]|nr:GAF domain-containing protein [Polyangiaceae bacterium]
MTFLVASARSWAWRRRTRHHTKVFRTRGSAGADVVVSRALLEAILGRRESVIVRDAEAEAHLRTLHREGILSAMAVPLGFSTRPVGLLYVDDRRKTERFGVDDLAYLTALGHLVSAALQKRRTTPTCRSDCRIFGRRDGRNHRRERFDEPLAYCNHKVRRRGSYQRAHSWRKWNWQGARRPCSP